MENYLILKISLEELTSIIRGAVKESLTGIKQPEWHTYLYTPYKNRY